jgi:hypothetical protein
MTPEEALARVLAVTGISLPRGVLGPETWVLARALSADADPAADPALLAGAASAAHWPELRGPMEAALLRAAAGAAPEDAEAFEIVLEWAADEDPDTPLARALAVRAATELALADARARGQLRAAEQAVRDGGAIAADLLDLDPEDFAVEIAEYVAAGSRAEDIPELARTTGDPEIRAWARSAVARTDAPDAPEASAGVRHLASGDPPEDPAEDLVWVPTILALTQEAVERSLAEEASAAEAAGEG